MTPQTPRRVSNSSRAAGITTAKDSGNFLTVSETYSRYSAYANGTVEVKRYLNDAFVSRRHDPLVYWQKQSVTLRTIST